jgi:hypothetical protein
MLPIMARNYVVSSLSGAPDVYEYLLRDLAADDTRWDFCPDPERFTLREIVAHVADYTEICVTRFRRTLQENEPHFPNWDQSQNAIDNDYAHSGTAESLSRLRESRAQMSEIVRDLPVAAWARLAHREGIGATTLEDQAVMVAAHDGYHLQQIVQWLQLAAAL